MERKKLICLYYFIFIFQSMIFALIFATPTTHITVEESNTVNKDLLELAQRVSFLETKQIIYAEDRQRLTKLETKYNKDRQQLFEYYGHITETIKRQRVLEEENYTLNRSLVEMRNEQREIKQNMEEMRNEQQEIKQNVEEMRNVQQEVKQNIEEMRMEQQKIKQNMARMIEEMTNAIQKLNIAFTTVFQQNKENYANPSVDINELKHNMEVQITDTTKTRDKNKTLSHMVQNVQYGVGNKHTINQQQNNFSSKVKEIQNNIQNESASEQQIYEIDTNQIILVSDINFKFENLNQSLQDIQQRIRKFDTDISHLQDQYNDHYTDSSSTVLEIRNGMKQIESAFQQNIYEIDEEQVTRNLHIKSELQNFKHRLERSSQRIQTLDADFSRLQSQIIDQYTKVAFTATLNHFNGYVDAKKHLPYKVKNRINTGGGFKDTDSTFYCPHSGIYLISASIQSRSPSRTWSSIVKNRYPLVKMRKSSAKGWGMSSVTVAAHLDRGDKIWVSHRQKTYLALLLSASDPSSITCNFDLNGGGISVGVGMTMSMMLFALMFML